MESQSRPESRDLEIFQIFREQAITLSQQMDTGRVRFEEVAAIVEKMTLVRNTDDGFGKVVLEMTRHNGNDTLRIRTVLDKIVKPLQFEKDIV